MAAREVRERMILFDTNILVYATDASSPRHAVAHAAVQRGLSGDVPGVLLPQVLLEFYATVTSGRAARPLSAQVAWAQIETLLTGMPMLGMPPAAVPLTGELISQTGRQGARVFDLFLAAQMHAGGIDQICTDNVSDFRDLGVQALTPEQVLGMPPSSRGWLLRDGVAGRRHRASSRRMKT